jgi:DNA-binding MarR family transcriptional regulator
MAPATKSNDSARPQSVQPRPAHRQDVLDLVELSRLLVSVAYRSLVVPEASVPLPQFRALAILDRHGPCTAGGLAEALDQIPSTVTRICDKLVAAGLVTRQNRPDNRREVEVKLTGAGHQLVQDVLTARAAELEQMLKRMPRASRTSLATALPDLLTAADRHSAGSRLIWAV